MKNTFVSILAFAMLLAACDNTVDPNAFRSDLLEQIKAADAALSDTSQQSAAPNHAKAENALALYEQFADSFPQDSLSPLFLFRGAQLAIAISRFQKAIKVLERICNAYPKNAKTPDAVFLIAFVYDEHIKYKAKAKEWYEKLIRNYPDHTFAKDAKAAIATLNMSDEEIIQMLKDKNSAQDSLTVAQ